MQKYAIFLDLDGTLLSTINALSQKTIDVLKHLSDDGHIIVLCTGRQLYSSLHYYKQLDLTTPLITLNGATIYNEEQKLIFHETLPRTFIDLLLNNALLQDVVKVYDFEIPNQSIVSTQNEHLLSFLEAQMAEGEKPNVQNIATEQEKKLYQSSNIYAFLEKKDYDKYSDQLLKLIPHEVGFRQSGDGDYIFFEFYPQTINKATGIAFVIQTLGLDDTYETMAFGDGTNDIDMLASVSHGVVMENACKEAHAISNIKTTYPNTDSGVAHYLIDFFNLKDFK